LPERLAFEITEGVIIDNLERALVVLHELHARGLQVHVDDFGTGYSSLQALHRLPIDALKIDKSFVAGRGHDDRTAELVRTIVQLGNNLGVVVIAEGVETAGQHDCLRELGCGCGQGYLFTAPVPAAGLESLIAKGHFRPRVHRPGAPSTASPLSEARPPEPAWLGSTVDRPVRRQERSPRSRAPSRRRRFPGSGQGGPPTGK